MGFARSLCNTKVKLAIKQKSKQIFKRYFYKNQYMEVNRYGKTKQMVGHTEKKTWVYLVGTYRMVGTPYRYFFMVFTSEYFGI